MIVNSDYWYSRERGLLEEQQEEHAPTCPMYDGDGDKCTCQEKGDPE